MAGSFRNGTSARVASVFDLFFMGFFLFDFSLYLYILCHLYTSIFLLLSKAFKSFLVFQTLKTCAIHLFHSLLPLPKREKGLKKMNNTILFSVKEQGLKTRKLWKLLAKEEEDIQN